MIDQNSIRIGRQLKAWMDERQLSESDFARQITNEKQGFSVSQSWISRICAGHFTRLGGKTGVVLAYANVSPSSHGSVNEAGKKLLEDALHDVWDGSLPNAKALAGLLRSVAEVGSSAHR